MNRTLRNLVIFFVAVCSAPAVERDIVRTFPVADGCTLKIEATRGAIQIVESDTSQIRVAVRLEIGADTETEADRLLRDFELSFEQADNTVAVRARNSGGRARFVWNEEKQIEPTFRVTVPRRCNVDVRTALGSITIGNVSGRIRAIAVTGDVFLRTVDGEVQAQTETGDLIVSRCNGRLSARVGEGMIRVGTVTQPFDLKTASGSIEVLSAQGGGRLHAEAGDAHVNVPRELGAPLEISTSGGDIHVQVDPAAKVHVVATASPFATVESTLPLKVEAGRAGTRRLSGRLNEGDVRVVARAAGGGVTLTTKNLPIVFSGAAEKR